MNYQSITLDDIMNWLATHGSTALPLEYILLSLATGETDIDDFRNEVMGKRNQLN